MKVLSTQDVSLPTLSDFKDDLHPHFDIEVDESQYFFKSAQPPSWIACFADASWWLRVFGAYAALYIAEIVKEAGKATWKDRAVVAAAIQSGAESALRAFAGALCKLRVKITPRTRLIVGVPVPDEAFGARLLLDDTDQDLLEIQLALFFHHLPKFAELIRSQQLQTKAFGGIQLRLLPDGSLEARWLDSDTEKER